MVRHVTWPCATTVSVPEHTKRWSNTMRAFDTVQVEKTCRPGWPTRIAGRPPDDMLNRSRSMRPITTFTCSLCRFFSTAGPPILAERARSKARSTATGLSPSALSSSSQMSIVYANAPPASASTRTHSGSWGAAVGTAMGTAGPAPAVASRRGCEQEIALAKGASSAAERSLCSITRQPSASSKRVVSIRISSPSVAGRRKRSSSIASSWTGLAFLSSLPAAKCRWHARCTYLR
mmetsp:Transcript_43277/g.106851  ORF Transcript_43277/g.106851 Transcript_43277/m.106851 type:complete len:234 (+) Transcript_43277:158-859(+)